jgi:putative flippase GtrA
MSAEHQVDLPVLHRQLLRFIIVGMVCTGIDATVMWMLVHGGSPPSIAKACSFVVGMSVGYFANKIWTFGSMRRGWREPMLFIALYAVALIANVAMYAAVLSLSMRLTPDAPKRAFCLAFVLATATSTLLNFLGSRTLVFRSADAR